MPPQPNRPEPARMPLDPEFRKKLRGLGHALHPVVTVAGNGLSETVRAEIERALHDHELIKVKLVIAERDLRHQLVRQIATDFRAEVVQEIGKVVLVYRRNPEPNPRLTKVPRST